jgi:hypothetical protein
LCAYSAYSADNANGQVEGKGGSIGENRAHRYREIRFQMEKFVQSFGPVSYATISFFPSEASTLAVKSDFVAALFRLVPKIVEREKLCYTGWVASSRRYVFQIPVREK